MTRLARISKESLLLSMLAKFREPQISFSLVVCDLRFNSLKNKKIKKGLAPSEEKRRLKIALKHY